MAPAEPLLLAVATVAAAGLSLAEAAVLLDGPGHSPWGLCLRRTPGRALALGLLLVGLQRLAAQQAVLVWSELNAFLLRQPPAAAGGADWLGPALLVAAGLVLGRATLPPVAASAGGALVAFGATTAWLAVAALLPLRVGPARHLLAATAAVTLPAAWCAVRCWRLAASRDDQATLQRLSRPLRRLGLVLAVVSLVIVRDTWLLVWLPAALAAAVAGLGALLLGRAGADALRRASAGPPRLPGLLLHEAWGPQRRPVWLLAVAVAGLLHWFAVAGLVPATAAQGRTVLTGVAAWPQLLCGTPEPSPAAWAEVAGRLRAATNAWRGHPWCGQWLLLLAWIEATRLNNFYTASLLLKEARTEYGAALARAPLGWHRGRTVGAIANRTLHDWGRFVEPGAHPG